ncbi:DUF5643 domain-containing protein [Paenibacillus crassostreae]|uniref:DUF5643 domain-containing protein n=1 Tax=Paenibacillus crassostreae TaxID=1763538 RepID=A0A162RSY3_9BACL|nr:DUF5643 domain-containing protein [Paenibacillus crassostreae]AOZ91295.1 hypothetical protein LPB68_03140 [Paenibacillus crassostreae]OAB74547.1 hypothetical protein PNBC_10820 [Paenibacillus crassostreae]
MLLKNSEFNLTIPVDHERFAELQSEYIIGETIQVEGQSISFTKAIVSPLRISLYVDYDEDNSKQIFGPGDIHLVDDKGTVWRNISGSLGPGRDHQVYHFESPYFEKPKSLMIEGSWFRALDKNQLSVMIDTEKGQLLKSPDVKLNLSKISNFDKYMKLDFALSGLDAKDNMMYFLFEGEFTDGDGNHYKTADLHNIVGGYMDGSEPKSQHSLFYVDKLAYKQPLTLTIYDYPTYIHQDYTVRIK